MSTSYCDRYTYFQVYGHYPPDDGSLDPAVASGGLHMTESATGEAGSGPEVTAKVVTAAEPRKFDMQTSDVAETKTVEPEPEHEDGPEPATEPEPVEGAPATE